MQCREVRLISVRTSFLPATPRLSHVAAMELSRKHILAAGAFVVLMLSLAFHKQLTRHSAPNNYEGGGGTNTTAINWLTDLSPALAKAKETGRPIMVDFFATWCGPCKMLDAETYSEVRVAAASTNWIMVRIDVDKKQALSSYYAVQSIPTILVLSPEGKELRREVGFIAPGPMLALLQNFTNR